MSIEALHVLFPTNKRKALALQLTPAHVCFAPKAARHLVCLLVFAKHEIDWAGAQVEVSLFVVYMGSRSIKKKNTRRRPHRVSRSPGTPDRGAVPPGSVGQLLALLYRSRKVLEPEGIPEWPPDLFAIVAYLLQHTGEYRRVLQPVGTPKDPAGTLSIWKDARRIGRSWRKLIDDADEDSALSERFLLTPEMATLKGWWDTVVTHANLPVAKIETRPKLIQAFLQLLLASDECCKGVGIDQIVAGGGRGNLCTSAEYYLANINKGRSLCLRVRPEVVCVLPKLHTPQVGMTLRSLTHNLALCRSSEVRASWIMSPMPAQRKFNSLNLLLLPWPTEIKPTDFRVVLEPPHNIAELAKNAVYQEFAPKREDASTFAARVDRALALACEQSGEIHGVVFPECALNVAQYLAVEKVAWRHGVLLIAGVQESGPKWGRNVVIVQPLGLIEKSDKRPNKKGLDSRLETTRLGQYKHHRWCLDRPQILQYELGGRLPASRRCWEFIDIEQRELNFLSLGDWLSWCALVCEDLARQDPTAEIIRSVGPSLVVALLMDGPQLTKRWPARYAAVLSDDPGSSVLTLTNLGLARRSRPLDQLGTPRAGNGTPTVVALWNDRVYGMREIALSGKEDSCVLNLVCHSEQEFTADAHPDDTQGHFVVYAGHVPFCSSP